MKKPILIVRTVSIEKLNTVISLCKDRWPDHPLSVITLPGREGELLVDERIEDVLLYASPTGVFNEKLQLVGKFEALIFPLGNKTGWGYANVYRALSLVNASKYYLAPYCNQLSRTSWLRLRGRTIVESLMQRLASLFSGCLAKDLHQQVLKKPEKAPLTPNEQKLDLVE